MLKVRADGNAMSIRFLDAIEDTGVCEVQQGYEHNHILIGMYDESQAAIDRDTMRELLPFFQRFVDTGTIKAEG